MKHFVIAVCGAVLFGIGLQARAEEKNGLRVTVSKTTLERDKNHSADYWDKVELALALKAVVKNISMTDRPEGVLEYEIVVERWGNSGTELYTGTEKLPALVKGQEVELVLGKVKVSGYESASNRSQYKDKISGWRVRALYDGKETVAAMSSSSFERMRSGAKPGH